MSRVICTVSKSSLDFKKIQKYILFVLDVIAYIQNVGSPMIYLCCAQFDNQQVDTITTITKRVNKMLYMAV